MSNLWNLNDALLYQKFHSFEIPKAFTYADMREGYRDRDKRELIRETAAASFPQFLPEVKWWAFRIIVNKKGRRAFDIENVPKLVIDAFCSKQIEKDGSEDRFRQLGLYADDTVDHVRLMQVFGERAETSDRTHVEIFGYVG